MSHITQKHSYKAKSLTPGLLAPLLALSAAAGMASAATPTVFASCAQLFRVNGLAATQNKILFTTQPQTNMYQVDASGTTCSLFAVIPATSLPVGEVEEYIAISPGLGGFPANDIYVTQFEKVFRVSPDGTSVTLFATIPDFTNHTFFHSGITFDQSGNYGFKMIVTGQNNLDGHGEVFTISSSGTATKLTDLGGAGNFGITEGPQVTLSSFTPAPGRLLVTQELQNVTWIINPDGSKGTLNNLNDIAGTNVIPANVCTLVASAGSFFTSDEGNGRILKYAGGAVPPAGGVLLPVEFDTQSASVYLQNNSGAISVFDNDPFVGGAIPIIHEGSTFVTCNAGTACPLSPGYWKNHAFPTTETFPVTIGGQTYSKNDFVSILNNPGGGNAIRILGFQLIAALLNIANDATVPANVAATIADAENLLSGHNLLTGFVAPSSPLGQLMVADANTLASYNTTPCNH
jgi:hypothetical protein